MRKAAISILNIMFVFLLAGCGKKMDPTEAEESETAIESNLPENAEDSTEDSAEENRKDILQAPSKEEVLAMGEKVLDGMSPEEAGRLKENIKTANLQMESAYLNENIFEKLSDKDSVYWQFFHQKGDIQHNRFDADNFIDLTEDMMNSVQDESLSADLRQLIDLTDLAAATHDVQYANEIYKILHDLDYFLLRYGIEDVENYTQDAGTVAKYYGVLNVYGGKPFKPENKYYIAAYLNVDNDETEYGSIREEHEEFKNQNGSSFYYYDMDCFYFDEAYPVLLNKALQKYYDSKKESYQHNSETYADDSCEESNIPYDSLIFQHISYVGDDYVSLLFNDVSYMGGAHPYSALDGITIDCGTGEIVTVDRFIDDSDEEAGEQIKTILGMDIYEPREWDYYITDRNVVFFYYDPRFWDLVATKRLR